MVAGCAANLDEERRRHCRFADTRQPEMFVAGFNPAVAPDTALMAQALHRFWPAQAASAVFSGWRADTLKVWPS
jgi:hypothetical protein